MKPIDIGVATIIYDAKNSVKEAYFKPTMELVACDKLIDELKKIHGEKNVALHAEVVFASWFNKMNEVELADREQYEIKNYVMPLVSHPVEDGNKQLSIRFVFEKRS